MTIAGAVVLHLGPLDESVVRSQDIYLCVRPSGSKGSPELAVACLSTQTGRVHFRSIDPDSTKGASLGPLAVEAMLAEELPQLLQTLLVGVERVICRLPLDDLSFPSLTTTSNTHNNDTHASLALPHNNLSATNATANIPKSTDTNDHEYDEDAEVEGTAGANRRPNESGLKRRELITKNKMMGTKYALLRAIKSENSSLQSGSPGQVEVNAMDALAEDISGAGLGLGGGLAFPHIDSDEESADEANKRSGNGQQGKDHNNV